MQDVGVEPTGFRNGFTTRCPTVEHILRIIMVYLHFTADQVSPPGPEGALKATEMGVGLVGSVFPYC